MEITLPYGDKTLALHLLAEAVKQVFEPRPLPEDVPEEALVNQAMRSPVGSPPLSRIVNPGETACIVAGDMTRLWVRHHILLPPILDELNAGGIPDENILIISATGDHREQTEAEHRLLVGDAVYGRVQVIDHRAKAAEENVYVGTTRFGTPVLLNKNVVEADRLILTGGVVYHFLAGWGGGKKAVIPGVAAYETIMKNHSLAFNPGVGCGLNPEVCAGRMEGNPCSEDMLEGAALAKPDFLVNSVIDDETHRIACVMAGDYREAHRAACDFVNHHFGVPIAEEADLVIASCGGYPKDINFYQAYKTLYNAHFALRRGGTLLLLAECREGIGSGDFEHIFLNYANSSGRESCVRAEYTIGRQMGYHTSVIADDYNVLVLSSLPHDTVAGMGMVPLTSLDEGLERIRRRHGGIPPAYIMPFGGTTFPLKTAG